MKKILLATFATAVLATSAHADKSYKNGLYMGAQAGASFMNHKHNVTFIDNGLGVGTSIFKKSKSKAGFTGGVFAGGRMFTTGGWAAGLELAGNFNSGKTSFTTVDPNTAGLSFGHSLKQKWNFNPALHLGRAWGCCFLYAKFGASMKKFSATTTAALNGVPVTGAARKTSSKTRTAFTPGLGFEWAFHNAFSLRGEVDHEFHGKIKNTLVDPTGNSFTSDANKIKVRTTNVRLGLLYRM